MREISPYTETMAIMGQFDFIIEYSYEAEDNMIGGRLIRDLKRSKGVKFERTISKLVERIEQIEH